MSGVVRDRPIQQGNLQHAGHHPGRLSQRQLEQNLDRRTKLDGDIKEHRRATRLLSGGTSQIMSFCSQTSKEPRVFTEVVYLNQFVVQKRACEGFVMQPF